MQFYFPIQLMLLISEALSSFLTFMLLSHTDNSDRLKLKVRPIGKRYCLWRMFRNVELSDTCSSGTPRQTCMHTCAILWDITKPAEQNGNFIMIAAGISGHNYQRWLIHFLIASFNLFTFGAEECQAGANESNLLQGCGTDTSQRRLYVAIFMMTGILWSHSSALWLNNVVK